MTYLLAGNPNCGKSTLFSVLTGSGAHIGNFPGVTVECRTGTLPGGNGHQVVDLPGIYSLTPFSAEEKVALSALQSLPGSVILNVVDATAPARGLYLTLQLLTLGRPMLVILSHMDEAERAGCVVDSEGLSATLGVTVFAVSGRTGQGIAEVLRVLRQGGITATPSPRLPSDGPVPAELKNDPDAARAYLLYQIVDVLTSRFFTFPAPSGKRRRHISWDNILTHPIFGYPLFFLLVCGGIWASFTLIGQPLSRLAAALFGRLSAGLGLWLSRATSLHPFTVRLLSEGILGGIGGVFSFLPTVLSLYLFLSLLEDSGYLARAAFLFDRPMRALGLSGRSFVPLLLGFGCSVPALLATRTLPGRRDRFLTALLVPFALCSAKLPVMAAFLAAFFPRYAGFMLVAFYLIGLLTGILTTGILSRSVFRGEPGAYILEIPPYRLPTFRNTARLLGERARELFGRLFGVILVSSVLVFVLSSLSPDMRPAGTPADSLLALLGRGAAVLLAPLGLNDTAMAAALLCGLCAKEAILSTLSVLSPLPGAPLEEGLVAMFTPAQALVFLVFALLYTPCAAALTTARKEGGRRFWVLFALLPLALAWVVAFLTRLLVNL